MKISGSRSLWLAVSVVIVTGAATPAPARAQSSLQGSRGVDPADEPYAKLAPVDPPTPEERLPVVDLSELPGLWPEDVVESYPGKVDPLSPEDAIEGAELLATEGDAATDVFGVGDASALHLALIEAEPRNQLDADGSWTKRSLAIEAAPGGWTWTDPAGVRFVFPTELSAASPVVIEAGEGSLSVAPSQPLAVDGGTDRSVATFAGIVEGSSVTYRDAVAGYDLAYTATPLGVQEQIVLDEAPEDATFRFALTTKALSLVPNPNGGLDVMSDAGEQVGTIPGAVADDSSPDVDSALATYELSTAVDGTLELALVFEPEYFASATYPVVIDPVINHEVSPHRDGYVQQSTPAANYESNVNLKVGSGLRSFLRFDMAGISNADRLVYDASLFLYPTASGGVSGSVAARRTSQSIPAAGTLNWNNQPAVGANDMDVVFAANSGNWWQWQLEEMYQHIIDPTDHWNNHWDNNGVRLSAATAKTFYATEVAGTADPVLLSFVERPAQRVQPRHARHRLYQRDRVAHPEGGGDPLGSQRGRRRHLLPDLRRRPELVGFSPRLSVPLG
ncbi:MAG: DUF7594 domain-containing protein [Actinomycetota bacterium]